MDTLDRKVVRALSVEIETALQPLAKQHGVSIRIKGGTFQTAFATLKLEIATTDEKGEAVDQASIDFKMLAPIFGLSADDLGTIFSVSGEAYKIIGARPRAKKRPILCECLRTRKRYAFAAEDIKLRLAVEGLHMPGGKK
jgi:hypothetical protein